MFGAILYHTVLFCRKMAKNCVTAPPTTTDNRVRAVPSGPGLPGIESGGGCRPPNRWFQGFVLSRFRSILVVLCHHRSIWLDEAIHIYKYINPVNRYPAANLGNWTWGDLSACQGLPAIASVASIQDTLIANCLAFYHWFSSLLGLINFLLILP